MSMPMNRFQEQFGVSTEQTASKVRDHMHAWIQEFIRQSPFAVMATANRDGRSFGGQDTARVNGQVEIVANEALVKLNVFDPDRGPRIYRVF